MARPGGRGRPARRVPSLVLVPVLVVGLLLAACGDDDSTGPSAAPAPRTIAFLRAVQSSQPENQAAFLDELSRNGYVVGDNLELVAGDVAEVYPDPAAAEAKVREWAAGEVDLIIALSTVGARAAEAAAPDVKVLFLVNDPIGAGLVIDVRRPSGNLTGATFRVPADRTLDVARRALPAATTIGVVYPPADPAALALADEANRAAATLGIGVTSATFTGADDAAAAVETVRASGAQAVWVLNSPTSVRFIEPLAAAAKAAGLPVISNTTVASAVVTLQPDPTELYRQIARQAIEVFEGKEMSDIPVENPSKFLVEVNLKAAAAIGVTVPEPFVASADRVIR